MTVSPTTAGCAHAGTEDEPGQGTHPRQVRTALARARDASPGEREEILTEVICAHLPLARSLAARYRGRGEPLEDLVQVASMALVQAVRRFDPDRGTTFEAYAVPTITGELRRYFRDHTWAVRPPRHLQELRSRLVAATETLTHRLHRAPTTTEVADHLGVSEDQVRAARLAATGYRHLGLDQPLSPDRPATLADTLGGDDERLEALLQHVAAPALLAELDPRERDMLVRYHLQGATQAQIGAEYGLSQMHVSRLLARTRDRLRRLAAPPEDTT